MRKRVVFLLCVAAAGFAGAATSKLATQGWVTNYVASQLSTVTSNGCTVISAGGVSVVLEDSTEPALVLRGVTETGAGYGLEDGTILAFDEALDVYRAGDLLCVTSNDFCRLDVYSDGARPPAQPLRSFWWNRRWPAVTLADDATNRVCRILRTMIQPNRRDSILKK